MNKTARKPCRVSPNRFCNICGEYVVKNDGRTLTATIKIAYFHFFGYKMVSDKPWIPNVSCARCSYSLLEWYRGKPRALPFLTPMIWRQPENHHDNCYFCVINVSGYSKTNKRSISYPDLASVTKPVLRLGNEKIPSPPIPDKNYNLPVNVHLQINFSLHLTLSLNSSLQFYRIA